MAKLLYFGSRISENILQDKNTGFIVCLNVPVARTGWQTYTGAELGEETQKVHGIKPTDKIKGYRSPEEVFSKETIASFETDPVTDNHPSGGRFVDSENFKQLVCGHGQNVRKGDEMSDGEEELLADLAIQHKGLVDDVLQERKREISCGYDYKLRLRPDGNFEQYEIRGNHFAVVPKGRAGDKVRINDAAPPEEEETTMAETATPLKKPDGMSWKKFLIGLGTKHFAMDAKPEEVAEAQDELRKEEGAPMPEAKKGLSEEELKAKDAELTEREKKADEREAEFSKREEDRKKADDAKRADDSHKADDKRRADDEDKHPDGCRCSDCSMARDKAKDSKRGMDAPKGFKAKLRKMLDEMPDDEDEPEPKKDEAKDKKADDKKADDKKNKDDSADIDPAMNPADDKKAADGLDPIPEVTAKEETKNPIPGADSAAALDVLRDLRPMVAKSGDAALVKKWNRARDAIMDPASAGTRNGYDELAELSARATDSDPDGQSAADRAKAYQDRLNASNSRARKEN